MHDPGEMRPEPAYDAVNLLPEAVRVTFRAQIEFINRFTDRPQERFRAFRESRVLAIGSGAAFTALAIALVRAGLKKLFLVPGEERQEVLRTLEPEIERLGNEGCEIFLSTVDLTAQSSTSNLRNYDVVVYCSENESLNEVFALNRRCIGEERPFLPAVTFAGRALIGPFVRSAGGPCWLCAQMRLAANMSEGQSATLWRTMLLGDEASGLVSATALSAPAARRIGHDSGFELFKLLSGVLPSETEDGIIFQELDNLETSYSALVQHPLCPHCSQPVRLNDSRVEQLQEVVAHKRDSRLTHDELLQSFSPLIDSRSGLFSSFADEGMPQLPLKGTKLVAGSPTSGRRLEMLAYSSESVFAARALALRQAVRRYAQELAETQHLLLASCNELAQRGKAIFAPPDLRTWTGKLVETPHTRLAWLPAFSLLKQTSSYVPAAAVYPCAPLNRLELFAKTSAGLATGTTFREVLTIGLRTALAYQALQALTLGEATLQAIEPDALLSGDAGLTFLLHSAQSFARPFALREVRHSWPISVVLVFTTDGAGEQILSLGSGLSGHEAAEEALLDFTGKLQYLAYTGQLPRTEDELFPHLSSIVARARVQEGISTLDEPGRTLEQIEDCLRVNGEDILYINTTPPDIWETRTLLAGTILLTRNMQEERGELDVRTEQERPDSL